MEHSFEMQLHMHLYNVGWEVLSWSNSFVVLFLSRPVSSYQSVERCGINCKSSNAYTYPNNSWSRTLYEYSKLNVPTKRGINAMSPFLSDLSCSSTSTLYCTKWRTNQVILRVCYNTTSRAELAYFDCSYHLEFASLPVVATSLLSSPKPISTFAVDAITCVLVWQYSE